MVPQTRSATGPVSARPLPGLFILGTRIALRWHEDSTQRGRLCLFRAGMELRMVYEWDEKRARKAQLIKLASAAGWVLSFMAVPAAIVLAMAPV